MEAQLASLMKAALAGDAEAYRQVLHELRALAEGFLRRRLFRAGELDDVVQEVLISLHRARPTWDPAQPLLPWFYAIVRYRFADHLRKSGRIRSREKLAVEAEAEIEAVDAAPLPDSSAPDSLGEDLQRALAQLPDRQRQVVTLLKVEGVSVKAISARLGMSESAVKVTAHRAYRSLRKKLEAV